MKFIKKFLVAILCLGLLLGMAYSAMMIGNRGNSGVKEPQESEEPETVLAANEIMIDGVKYEFEEDASWDVFLSQKVPFLEYRYEEMICSTDDEVLCSGDYYPRYTDEIRGATVYELKPLELREVTVLDVSTGENIIDKFYIGGTWSDWYFASSDFLMLDTGGPISEYLENYNWVLDGEYYGKTVIATQDLKVLFYDQDGLRPVSSADYVFSGPYYLIKVSDGLFVPPVADMPSDGDLVPQEPVPVDPVPQEPLPDGPSDLPNPEEPSASI